MREIKFRAWVDNKDMVYLDFAGLNYFDFEGNYALSFVVDAYNGFYAHECYEKIKPEYKLMQFTGLKDKKGREIYEGDILQLINADEEVVNCICEWGIHRREMASGSIVDIPGFSFVIKTANFHSFPIVKNYLGKHDLEIIEVIGNIYSNPELLNQK